MTFKQYKLLPLLNNESYEFDHPHSNEAVYRLLYIAAENTSASATIENVDDNNGYGA